ncbi:MAG: AMP-binding protein, partial [Coriobacteriales bacterium]|nr:AMP-binding protein [Coriobacteriales bacterium]
MRKINERYTHEDYDESGVLRQFSLSWPDDFSFSCDVVDDIAINDPDRRAMVWCNPEGEEHVFSFADLKYWSDKTANYLLEQGIGAGDLVMVILRRHYQFWFVALALDKIGAVIVPATFMLKEHDVRYRVNSAGIKAVICTDVGEIAQVIDNALPDCPTLTTRILVNGGAAGIAERDDSSLSGPQGLCALAGEREGWLDFNTEVRTAVEGFERRPSRALDPMIAYFSSGTSGNPKLVLHNSSYALAHLGTAKHWQNVVSDEGLHFSIADTGWGKAVWGKFYGQWLMEAAVMVYDFDRFSGDAICALIERYRITTFCCPPTMYRMIMQGSPNTYDLSSLVYSVSAGEALNPDVFEQWQKLTGLKIFDGFGQTETPVTICNSTNMEPRLGSMGRPLALYDTHILDEQGLECAVGQTGEICIRTDTGDPNQAYPPGLLMDYYRQPERTAEAIHDGWYHTGDTAWRDEDGFYFYVGRNDDVIKSSGYRISPFEIESVLLTHPAINECAVTGVPDELRGKAVKATVVLAPGYEAT